MKFGSLFAGIGGFDLGLERAGMECAWQVEIDDYCLKVLEKHWPDVSRYTDVRECGRDNLEPVDLICGGFPCVDISRAGKKEGINGKDSGLWIEFFRIIGELRPQYAVVENVSDLLWRGASTVFGDLASIGYDAEWEVVPAAATGSPQIRERLFIVAYPHGKHGSARLVFHEENRKALLKKGDEYRAKLWAKAPAYPMGVAHGVPARVDRLRILGNAVVPQVVEFIGRRILASSEVQK